MRRIAIISQGNNLDSKVNACFGKTKYVSIIYWDGMIKAHDTHYVVQDSDCTGPKLAKDLAYNYQIEAIVTKHIGSNAYSVFQLKGIDVYLPKEDRTVEETASDYFNGSLESLDLPNSPSGNRCKTCSHSCSQGCKLS